MQRKPLIAEERANRLEALLCALYDTGDTGRRTTASKQANVRANLIRVALDEAEALVACVGARNG